MHHASMHNSSWYVISKSTLRVRVRACSHTVPAGLGWFLWFELCCYFLPALHAVVRTRPHIILRLLCTGHTSQKQFHIIESEQIPNYCVKEIGESNFFK